MSTPETEQQLETNKNLKALGMTAVVVIGLFLIFFLVSWTTPVLDVPPPELGVEVNLGNSDFGSGNVAPQAPGEPSSAAQNNSAPPPTASAPAETEKEVIPNNDPNATPVNTSPKPEKNPHKAPTKPEIVHTKPKLEAPPTRKPEKPKTLMPVLGGNHSNGGNDAKDDFNKINSQGPGGGNRIAGKANGVPSGSFTGNGGTGTSGVSISNGLEGRGFSGSYHFKDSYDHGGTVMVDVTVDASGNVTSATARPSGNPELNPIAEKEAKLIKFTKGTSDQNGTIRIKFEEPRG